MNKKALLILIIFAAVFIFSIYQFYSSRTSKISGLKIISQPVANIFLNEKLIGRTPYDDKQPSGEYTLKLIPDDPAQEAVAWQGKISLNPKVLTYVNRELGKSELRSAGEVLTLEKINNSSAEIAVMTAPDASTVLLDGQEKGTAPIFIKDVVDGEHDVVVASSGFIGRTVRVQTTSGYRLNVNFQLSIIESESSPSVSIKEGKPKDMDQGKTMVTVKDTPTGFLRVRSGPSLSATETGRIKPGEKYPLLEEQEGWLKISLEEGKEGWISGRYAEK